MIRIGGQSKQYGAELQEMINLKRFYFTMISWWDPGCRNIVSIGGSSFVYKRITNNKYHLLPDPFLPTVTLLENE